MFSEIASEEDKRDFLAELDLMKTLDHHPNVISLYGCVSKSGKENQSKISVSTKAGFHSRRKDKRREASASTGYKLESKRKKKGRIVILCLLLLSHCVGLFAFPSALSLR